MRIKKAAVIVDGGFARKTFQKYFRQQSVPTPDHILALATRITHKDEELFRIYYYDCLPFEKALKTPVSKNEFKDTDYIGEGKKYIGELASREKVAFRAGELKFGGWALTDAGIKKAIQGRGKITDTDFKPLFKQKRVDIKIGLDIAWLSIRKMVDRIILIAGDSDFVPAMKLSRNEGVQVVVSPLRNRINKDMREHADEIRDFDISGLRVN
jgi:uncharacterized LabA/DUF88 family protein